MARIKLEWWRGEVAAIYDGAPQHPVAKALKPVVKAYELPQQHLQAVIDGMAMDLELDRYPDFAVLERYCDRVAGVVGLMSAQIFGYSDASTRSYARDLGIAFQLTNIIRDVGEDARRGRIYLPQDVMARFGVSDADVSRDEVSASFRELLSFQVQRARRFYDKAFAEAQRGRSPLAATGIDHGRNLYNAAGRNRARRLPCSRSPLLADAAAQGVDRMENIMELLVDAA